MRGRWKYAHVATCFGDDHVSDERRDAGDRGQCFPGNSKGPHDRVDLLRQNGDSPGKLIDSVQMQPDHKGMVLAKHAGERFG